MFGERSLNPQYVDTQRDRVRETGDSARIREAYFPLSWAYVENPDGAPKAFYKVDVRDTDELEFAQSVQPSQVQAEYTINGETPEVVVSN